MGVSSLCFMCVCGDFVFGVPGSCVWCVDLRFVWVGILCLVCVGILRLICHLSFEPHGVFAEAPHGAHVLDRQTNCVLCKEEGTWENNHDVSHT